MNYQRRTFIRQLGFLSGSILFVPACTIRESMWRFFTDEEAQTIIAIAEQFIPRDKDPGATDANVVNFIDKQLVGPYTRFQEEYRQGIGLLIKSSQSLFNVAFTNLEGDKQTQFLQLMEGGKLPVEIWDSAEQQSFFKKLLDHSMQGFYGSPRHGGNRNYVSYKMMKLDYPHVIGQNRYNSVLQQLKSETDEK
jgi:gluconate 2-dehydrogenase gamma chain